MFSLHTLSLHSVWSRRQKKDKQVKRQDDRQTVGAVTVKNKAESKSSIREGRLAFSRQRQEDRATLGSRLKELKSQLCDPR